MSKCGIVTWGKSIEHEHDALAELYLNQDHSCCRGGSSFLERTKNEHLNTALKDYQSSVPPSLLSPLVTGERGTGASLPTCKSIVLAPLHEAGQ